MKKKIVVPIQVIRLGEEGTHIFCKGKVNGFKVRILIDTGASKTVLAKAFADEMPRLKPVDVEDNTTSGIGPDAVDATFVMVKKLEFKSLKIKNLVVGTIDLTHVKEMYETLGVEPFDLILGGEVLETYNAIIDYKNKKLILNH
jgi:hypothetical protein